MKTKTETTYRFAGIGFLHVYLDNVRVLTHAFRVRHFSGTAVCQLNNMAWFVVKVFHLIYVFFSVIPVGIVVYSVAGN